MALDPSISLGVKTPEPLDITKFQQLRNLAAQEQATYQQIAASQTQQRAAEAGIPGIQAESELKQRAAKFKQWTTDKRNEFVNEFGMPDPQKFSMAAARDGYYTEAQAVAASDLSNQAQLLQNSRTEQDLNKGKFDFTQNALAHVSNLLENAPSDKRGQFLNQYAEFADKLVPGSGGQLRQAFQTDTVDKTGTPGVDDKKIKAVKESTASYLQQRDLAMRQAAQGLVFAQSAYTKNGQDPSSLESREFRNFVERNSGVKLPDNVSIFDVINKPIYKPIAEAYGLAQIVPAGVRAEATAIASNITASIESYDNAIKIAQSLPKPVIGTVIGTIGGEKYNRLIAQDPRIGQIITAAQIHNQNPLFKNDQIEIEKSTPEIIVAKLEQGKRILQNQAASAVSQAQRTTLPTAPGAVKNSLIQPGDNDRVTILRKELEKEYARGKSQSDTEAILRELNKAEKDLSLPLTKVDMTRFGAQTGGKTVRMINRQGKVFNIPENMVDEALKDGLKRAGQ